MAAEYFFREFEATQQQTLARAVQAHEAYLSALKANRPLKGGMHWKKINAREYLYKYRDRYGNGGSLGRDIYNPAYDFLWCTAQWVGS